MPEHPTPNTQHPSPTRKARIAEPLLAWYRAHQRDLPWRTAQPDPYAIWVSEIMLQQTQVATVIPYFQRWMGRFPTVSALAMAAEDDVLHAWQGLGYYSRARNLLRGARAVLERHGGRVPDRPEDLRALPGVGPYTAGAIASIAYNVPAPIVDGNVIRVLCRLFALRGDPKKASLAGQLWELAEALIPEGEARDFNPALMELGATICTPANPTCGICPVAEECQARRLGIQEQLPETAPRPKPTEVHMVAAVVWREGRVLLVQRREDESRWAGMWQFPNTTVGVQAFSRSGVQGPGVQGSGFRLQEAFGGAPTRAPKSGAVSGFRDSGVQENTGTEPECTADAVRRGVREAVGLEVTPGARVALIRHGVTRYRITLEAFQCMEARGEPQAIGCRAWNWVHPSEFGEYALPAAHARIAHRLASGEEQLELVLDH